MKPGDVPFCIPEADGAADQAREFCVSRGLGPDDVRIVRRSHDLHGTAVCVEVKRECVIKVA